MIIIGFLALMLYAIWIACVFKFTLWLFEDSYVGAIVVLFLVFAPLVIAAQVLAS